MTLRLKYHWIHLWSVGFTYPTAGAAKEISIGGGDLLELRP